MRLSNFITRENNSIYMTVGFQAKIIFLTILILGFFSWAESSQAADFYIRTGAIGTNDGSDWTNAWSSPASILWNSIQPGDTLHLSGNYSSNLVVQKDGLVGQPITIKAVTLAEHGTSVGWEEGFAGKVIFSNASINLQDRSNIVVDGNNNMLLQATVDFPLSSGSLVYIGSDSVSENIQIENMEIIGQGELTCYSIRGIGVYGLDNRVNNLTLKNLIVHEFSGSAIRLGDHNGLVIENNSIYNVQNASAEYCLIETGIPNNNPHNTHVSLYGLVEVDNVVIRNNNFYQEYDDNIIDGGYAIGFGYVATNVDIYNNTFFNVNNPILGTENPVPIAGGRINFFSNTLLGYRTISLPTGSSLNVANNIFCNNGFDSYYTRAAYLESQSNDDYNNLYCYDARYAYPYGTGGRVLSPGEDPFADIGTRDFHLKDVSYADSGKDLGVSYNFDFANVSRPQGAAWDNGAYEFVSAGDTTPPSAPSGLNVT